MNFSLDEIYGMSMDQLGLFCAATNDRLWEDFKQNVIAASWGMCGVPEEMQDKFK